jgi:predicted DNA-binding helix-hairpin-helix protein
LLPRDRDPKTEWALSQPSLFPLEINKAPRELLLRVPGLGPKSVERIIRARSLSRFQAPRDLEKVGVRVKKPVGYLLFDGKHFPNGQVEMFRSYQHRDVDRRRIDPKSGGTYT